MFAAHSSSRARAAPLLANQAVPVLKRRMADAPAPPLRSLSRVPAHAVVQPKCSGCAAEEREEMPVQPRLEVGPVGDRYEREADAIAGRVMAIRDSDISLAAPAAQRACSSCASSSDEMARPTALVEGEDPDDPVRARLEPGYGGSEMIGASHGELTGGGEPLPASTRAFFEQRMGRDLVDVRVHQGKEAARLNASIAARAFTYRNHVWLGAGEKASPSFTMAHELAHVLQQTAPGPVGDSAQPRPLEPDGPAGAAERAPVVRRGGRPDAGIVRRQFDDPWQHSNDVDDAAEREYADSGAPKAKKCGSPSRCPPGFCDPYPSEKLAEYYRAKNQAWIMAGIAMAVNSRVLPFWEEYLAGGSSPKNLTADFAKDFTNSKTTLSRTRFLRLELTKSLSARPPSVASKAMINIAYLIPTAIAALNDRNSPEQMNFNYPRDIPGNLAGGIGDDQTACPAGNKPSPFNDERHAYGYVQLTRISGSEISVTPFIAYKVQDTIDLCPGDCGNRFWPPEQLATVPLSQFEATGISGDVPFKVDFPAPAFGSFTISAPMPKSTSPSMPTAPTSTGGKK